MFAVGLGVDAEVGFFDGADDVLEGGGIKGLDKDAGGVGCGEGGEGAEVGGGAVVIDADTVDKIGGSAAGAEAAEFVLEMVEGFFHGFFSFEEDFVNGHGRTPEECLLWFSVDVDHGADGFAVDDAGDVAGFFQVEDDDGDFAFHGEADGGHVHDAEIVSDDLAVGELVEHFGGGVFLGVGVEDAVDFGGFEEDFDAELGGAEGGAGIGGEKGIAGAGGEDHDAAFFQVADHAAADERLADLADRQGGGDAGRLAERLEHVLEGHGVHDGGEHAHVVGGGALDMTSGGECFTADEVAAADDDGDLDAALCDLCDLFGDADKLAGVEAKATFTAEAFAGDFQQDALELPGPVIRFPS